jgi:hypothetical protein
VDGNEFLASLVESGDGLEACDAAGRPVALARMLSPRAILRSIKFSSPYIPHRVTHSDSRYPDPAELWRKWQAYLAEAKAAKREILAKPKAPPAPIPAASSPAEPVLEPPAPPSKSLSVVEVQRMLRRKGG